MGEAGRAGCAGTVSDGGLTTDERKELAQPRRENRRLREDVEILSRNVKRACELLKVSRAAFYQYLAGPSARERADAELASQITAVHQESKGRYGSPRVHARLARVGYLSPAEFEATTATKSRM